MLRMLLLIVETLFLVSFWLQTRINLREWWPDWFSPPLNSDYLIPFIYLSDILLLCLLLIWMAGKVLGIKRIFAGTWQLIFGSYFKNPMVWLGWFIVIALVSVLINGGAWWSWYGWLRLSEGILLSWYVYDRWQDTRIRDYAIRLLLAGLVLESVILIGEWVRQRSLGLQWLGEWFFSAHTPGIAKIVFDGQEYMRAYGTFAHPNVAAGALLLGVVVLGWWMLNNLGGDKRGEGWMIALYDADKLPPRIRPTWLKFNRYGFYILIAILALLGLGLFVTFSRSAWLACLASLGLLLVWFSPRLSGLMQSRKTVIGLLIGSLVTAVILGPMTWSRFNSLDSTDRLSIERRVQLNKVALNLLDQKPWLGVGVNNFVSHLANFGPLYGIGIWREPVHNLYLLVAVETGLIGIALWIIAHSMVWVRIGLRLWRGMPDHKIPLLLAAWVAVLLLGLIDHYWWTSQQGRLVWWLLLGASLAELSRGRDGQMARVQEVKDDA